VRSLGLDIRAGLHTGECELAGDAVRGHSVHVGARAVTLASAGEVMATGMVKDLVGGSGLRFESLGTRALKGLPGEWPVYR